MPLSRIKTEHVRYNKPILKIDLLQGVPETPQQGKVKLYFKDDGNLYKKTDSGVEKRIGGNFASLRSDIETKILEAGANVAADVFTNFVRDMEDHGRNSIHTENGFVDEFESSNDMIDEANSSDFLYNNVDDFYTNNSSGPFSIRTKQWTGTNGTPAAPTTSPEIIYLFVVDEQSGTVPQYAVSRDGNTFTNVTFESDWLFNGTKRARRATIDVSSQPAGVNPIMRVTGQVNNSNGEVYRLHAVGLQTKSS